MLLISLRLTNYRNHKKLDIDFSPQINLINGLNGSGKTNILEAINLLSTTKSFRAKYDVDLIEHNSDFAKVQGKIDKNGNSEDLEIQIIKGQTEGNRSTKKVKYNNVSKRLTNYANIFTTVLFSPESIDLITGSPSIRRSYIDSIFFQIDENYKKNITQYKKVVKQRNKLMENIKINNQGRDQIPYWNEQLLNIGAKIQEKRREYFEFLSNYLLEEGKELYKVKYSPNIITNDKINDYQYKEIFAGRTLMGPHLDDFTITFKEGELAQYGSRGQQRDAIFTLKLAEIMYLDSIVGEKPVLLLDDIFSELDDLHKEKVLKLIEEQQTIITSAENVQELINKYPYSKVLNI